MTQAFNLSQLANNLNTSGQLDATDGLTGAVPVANGGTGASSITANAVILGNGTSAIQTVAPSTSGNVLTSNGTTWVSSTPAGGGVTSLNGQTGAITNTAFNAIGSYCAGTILQGANATINAGNTASGSSIIQRTSQGSSAFDGAGNSSGGSSLGRSGTWRALTYGQASSANCCGLYSAPSILWVRIS